jgi:hypothetical protein
MGTYLLETKSFLNHGKREHAQAKYMYQAIDINNTFKIGQGRKYGKSTKSKVKLDEKFVRK